MYHHWRRMLQRGGTGDFASLEAAAAGIQVASPLPLVAIKVGF
jgi:hypothetical protein